MRTSTGAPTQAEAARMDAIKAGPCVCCHMRGVPSHYPDIHHLLSGGRRRGHMYTIGLCAHHHRGYPFHGLTIAESEDRFGPSLARGSKPFHEAFGSDDALLAYQNRLLGQAASEAA